MSFRNALREDLRLVLLRLLAEAGGAANSSVLQTGADAVGHRATREQVEQELAYLAGLGAVETSTVADRVLVARLTRRGQDHVDRRGEPLVGVKVPGL